MTSFSWCFGSIAAAILSSLLLLARDPPTMEQETDGCGVDTVGLAVRAIALSGPRRRPGRRISSSARATWRRPEDLLRVFLSPEASRGEFQVFGRDETMLSPGW